MVLEIIVGGLILGGAVAAIITYWNEIVEWINEFIDWAAGETYDILRRGEEIIGVIYDKYYGVKKKSPPKRATAHDMYKLYQKGVLTLSELGDRLQYGEIERLHRDGTMSDSEYNSIMRFR